MSYFSNDFIVWLDQHADELDQQSGPLADSLLERIAQEGVFRLGVTKDLGGSGGHRQDVIEALSELSEHSLTAGFISWGQRTFIETILASANPYAREAWLADLLTGKLSAGTGLSNCVKFISAIEELSVTIVQDDEGKLYLDGQLPWVTNVRSDNFVTVFAADYASGDQPPIILAVPQSAGIKRSEDLEFISLQGANTAALTFDHLPLDERWILSYDAQSFVAKTRPAFLGYQLGLAFGLAQHSLDEVNKRLGFHREVLEGDYQQVLANLEEIKQSLYQGLRQDGYFLKHVRELFQLRVAVVQVVLDSLSLELQALGGRGYLKPSSFARRWKEGAFLPIVSPSAVQLKQILAD